MLEILAIILISLLVAKELIGVQDSNRAQIVADFLYLPIVPVLILFIVFAFLRVLQILT